MKKLILLLAILTFVFSAHAQKIIYVNDDATGANNGTSWADAYTGFQASVNAASSGDSVFVAVGTYQPAAGAYFSMKQGVKIYGGFAGTESSLAQRDLNSGDTSILKGNNNTVIQNNNKGLDTTAVLDGFKITGGHRSHGFGGGMYNNNSSPAITNCTFSNDSSYQGGGGGMYNANSSPIITNCIFLDNNANTGGGMSNGNSSPVITNCTFSGNQAGFASNRLGYGGGIYIFNSFPVITNCIIYGNSSGIDISYSDYNKVFWPSEPAIHNSLVQGIEDISYIGSRNSDQDPLFADAANGDYRLKVGSPAINMGNNDSLFHAASDGGAGGGLDLAGYPRIVNGTVDIGAYEFQLHPDANGILYVDSAAASGGDGSSWSKALRYLSDALQLANYDTTVKSIYVAKGTYYPTGEQSNTNRDSTFALLRGGLKLYGGFDPANGIKTLNDTRILPSFGGAGGGSILSGDIGGAGADNSSYHVMVIAGIPAGSDSLIVDGFTVTGGNAYGENAQSYNGLVIERDYGGGMYIRMVADSVLWFNHCSFLDNQAKMSGGAMINKIASPAFMNCILAGNQAGDKGGGMYNSTQSAPLLLNCAVSGNQAAKGGGIYNYSEAVPSLVNCALTGNVAGDIGGGIGNEGGSLAVLTNCTVSGNRAVHGGGMYNNNSSARIVNSVISGNSSGIENTGSGNAPVIAYSLVQGMARGSDGNPDGNINPLFVNAPEASIAPFTGGDYRLQPTSPLINQGNNDSLYQTLPSLPPSGGAGGGQGFDLAGNPRISMDTVDMGAYEYQLPPITPDSNGVLYVDSSHAGDYAADGSSWGKALPYLSTAIKEANGNNTVRAIYVAKGAYYPTGVQSDTTRDSTFAITRGKLKIYGGFDPANGIKTLNDVRILPSFRGAGRGTILSGDINTAGNSLDNSYHVIVTAGIPADDSLVIDGFTITGGNADSKDFININGQHIWRVDGGGMVNNSSSPIVSHVIFTGNNAHRSGGGMENSSAFPSLTNVIFSGNSAFNEGGAMVNYSSSPVLTNISLTDNTASNGSGMYNFKSSPILTNVTLTGNTANTHVGMYNYQSSVAIANSIIWANIDGGGYTATYSLILGDNSTADGNIDATGLSAAGIFADSANGNYHLLPASPAINKGINDSIPGWDSTGLAGNPRIFDGRVDMGAYEFQHPVIHPDINGIIYVDSAAAPGGDGSSWAKAIPQLAEALFVVNTNYNANHIVRQIWVAKGTYKPLYSAEDGHRSEDGGKYNAFVLPDSVKIYGGFKGNETSPDQRPHGTETSSVLSGDIDNSHDLSTNDALHVAIAANVDSALLGGFTITGGNAHTNDTMLVNGRSIPSDLGGGIFSSHTSFSIHRCLFLQNSANNGGGMYNDRSDINVANCIFYKNQCYNYGGGLYNDSANLRLTNCTIYDNNGGGDEGAAMFGNHSNVTVSNSIIYENANSFGGDVINSDATFTYSLVQGIGKDEALHNLGGNTDPLFIDAANGNLQLQPASPVINKGNNDSLYHALPGDEGGFDLAGNARISAGITDMGAYEYQLPPITPDTNGILYVDSAAVYGGDGSSWGKALNYLSDAVAVADTSHAVKEIHVAQGTYYPTGMQNAPPRDSAFALSRGSLKLLGGYPTAGGERDPQANPTILSGDIGRQADTADNSYHVMVVTGINASSDSSSLSINGFAFTGGHANSDRLFVYNSDSLRGNKGSGIYIYKSSPSISNCSFSDNTAQQQGGGMYVLYSSSSITNCTFTGNTALVGGGMAVYYSSPSIQNSDFINNTASFYGGGMVNQNASPSIAHCVFSGNAAESYGGGLYNYTSSPSIRQSSFVNNKAQLEGGGIMNYEHASAYLINCLFSGNNAGYYGGGVYNQLFSSLQLTNVTVSGNTAQYGGALFNTDTSSLLVTNSIIYGNSQDEIFNNGEQNTTTVTYSDVQGGYSGVGNLYQDPLFADTANNNYSLLIGSPAINKGYNDSLSNKDTTDLTGYVRISDGRVDMGAFEYQIPVLNSSGILYVDSSAAPKGDGSSWGKALSSFGYALALTKTINAAAATNADSAHQIWVAKGIYQPDTGTGFYMLPKVQIYGGFAGTEASLSQRNLNNGYTSILKGNGNSVIRNINNGLDTSAVLNGFKITEGQGSGSLGGGIYNSGVSPKFSHLIISNNGLALGLGGGMFNEQSFPVIAYCSFSANKAQLGGGIYNSHSSPVIMNCIFSDNSANSGGGGIANDFTSSPLVVNCIFSGNDGGGDGEGMSNYKSSQAKIENCTFFGNQVKENIGISNYNSSPVITNCIIYGYSQGIKNNSSDSDPVVTYSIVQGGYAGTGNSDKDPQFADTANGDYRLKTTSPAINKGNNDSIPVWDSTDLAGNPRIFDDTVDMGAYEYQHVVIRPDANGILYVDSSNTDNLSANGDSWANALSSFTDALAGAAVRNAAAATAADSVRQIWVAKGTYQPEKDSFFYMLPKVKIYGGFAGTESSLAERDLSGGNTCTLKGNDSSVIRNNNNGLDTSAVLDGFIITGGSATDGGGIYNASVSPSLRHLIIRNNTADNGGGMYNIGYAFTPVLANVLISGNTADYGGGMSNLDGATSVLTNVTISGNTANESGGGILNSGSTVVLNNCIVWGNRAGVEGNEIDNSYRAAYGPTNSVILQYSLYANRANDVVGVSVTATNTLTFDPQFVDTANGNYQLLAISPAINKGNNAAVPAGIFADLAGNPRIYNAANGGIVDMGAYESSFVPVHPDTNGILYVDSSAVPNGDGSSWDKALPSFGNALAAAANINAGAATAADSVRQIWVARGTYQPDTGQSFAMLQHVKIYGSFAGVESSLGERKLGSGHTSILKGNGNSVIRNNNNGLDTSAVLDGFIITGGNSTGNGGGMYNLFSSPRLRNITISGNSANEGGGMYIYNSTPVLTNVLISGNTANYGGGMSNLSGATSVLTNVTISGNTADKSGGGIVNSGGTVVLNNCIVWGNRAGVEGNEIDNSYRAAYGPTNSVILKYSLYANGANDVVGVSVTASDTLSVDPQFVDTANGNYQLQPASPAINKGNNAAVSASILTDLADSDRIYNAANGGIVDMGAYEYQGNPDSTKITTQPKESTVCSGEDASFSVTATGGHLAYQWQLSTNNGASWSDATNATTETLTISNIPIADSGNQYRVIVSAVQNKDTSAAATLHVNALPAITLQPKDTTVNNGGNATFRTEATGTIIGYQWQSSANNGANWSDEAGKTTMVLALSGLHFSDNGKQYRVIVKGVCGNDTSASATLTVNLPVLTLSPATLPGGYENVAYSQAITASGGTGPYVYSITNGTLPDGLSLDGSTGLLSGTPTVQNTSSFDVKVEENGTGATTSRHYSLAIHTTGSCISISSSPASREVCEGSDATFSINVTGATGYQWESSIDGGSNWTAVPNATGATLSLTDVQFSETPVQYHVIVHSACGDITSGSATLVVNAIKHTILNEMICYGSAYNFGGKNISQSGTYYDTLHAATGCDSIVVLNLTANAGTVITSQPEDNTVSAGEDAYFTVTATGTDIGYQWQLSTNNGATWNDIPNETNTTLHLSNIPTSYNGRQYRAMVSGDCENITSNSATLTVSAPVLTISPAALSPGYASVAYSQSFSASGGTEPYTFTKIGTLPTGMTFANGKLSGTPTQSGNFTFSITAADNTSGTLGGPFSATNNYTLVINNSGSCINITSTPHDITVCEGGNASLGITTSGATGYQWQSSTDNGANWTDVQGATSATLSLSNIALSETPIQYHVIMQSNCGAITSGAATLHINAIRHTTLNKTICHGGVYNFGGKNISQAGTYYDTLSAATGCDSIVVMNLTVNANTMITLQPDDAAICDGSDATFTVKASGTNISYQWQSLAGGTNWKNVPDGTSRTLKISSLSTADNGAKYRVVVTGTCSEVISNVVKLTVNPLPDISITADSANPVSKGLLTHLLASGADSYQWSGSSGIQNGWNEAMLTIRPQQNATYTVTGVSRAGCIAKQSYDVKIVVDYQLVCNNIVSPNGDGKNDKWIIQNIDSYPDNELMVYDRAGRMVYHKKNYNNQWNGTVNGGVLAEGTYYYVFIVDGGKKVFKGYIELLSGKR